MKRYYRNRLILGAMLSFFILLVLAVTGVGLSLLGDSMTDILRRKGR